MDLFCACKLILIFLTDFKKRNEEVSRKLFYIFIFLLEHIYFYLGIHYERKRVNCEPCSKYVKQKVLIVKYSYVIQSLRQGSKWHLTTE